MIRIIALLVAAFLSGPVLADADLVTMTTGQSVTLSPLENDNLASSTTIASVTPTDPITAHIFDDGQRVLLEAPDFELEDTLRLTVGYSYLVDGVSTSDRIIVTLEPAPVVALTDIQLDVIGNRLLMILVLAVLLEQGLSVLFNWRPFRQRLDQRGLKMPIAFGAAFFFVTGFGINIVHDILQSFEPTVQPDWEWPGQALTALIIAGGSTLVFELFESFGLRAPMRNRDDLERQRKMGRLKVEVNRGTGEALKEPLLVGIGKNIVGTINADENVAPGRMSAGFPIEPGLHEISIRYWRKSDGQEIVVVQKVTVGPSAQIRLKIPL